ncbi:MAG TPA: hypothetical protein VFU80_07160 [Sphingomicrobium sp.]|nr:hypothetical protein [Sphingomicrobium sp.]
MLLLVAAVAIADPSPPRLAAQARASVRIERPVKVNRKEWERLPQSSRREVIRRDGRGRPILLRLVEQQ